MLPGNFAHVGVAVETPNFDDPHFFHQINLFDEVLHQKFRKWTIFVESPRIFNEEVMRVTLKFGKFSNSSNTIVLYINRREI